MNIIFNDVIYMTNIDNTNIPTSHAYTSFENKNNANISPDRYVFWMDDISVLFKDNEYIKFVPTPVMTRVEQLNAITRFFLYLIILLLIFDKADSLYIPIIGLIMVIILYNVFVVDEKGKRDELLRMKRKSESMRDINNELNYRTYQIDDDGDVVTIDIDRNRYNNKDTDSNSIAPSEYELEAGYYDSNGELHIGKYNDPLKSRNIIKHSLDEIRLYQNAKCRKPTVDNPFMNPSVADFNTENVPVACNADDEDIKNDMTLKFNEDMYRDIEDVFDKKNSQRQFFTVAHNVPNDMEAFARWCYKFPPTCKTNQERCLRYEDYRTMYENLY